MTPASSGAGRPSERGAIAPLVNNSNPQSESGRGNTDQEVEEQQDEEVEEVMALDSDGVLSTEGEYDVRALTGKRWSAAANDHEWLVEWDDGTATWEPQANLITCEALMDAYHRAHHPEPGHLQPPVVSIAVPSPIVPPSSSSSLSSASSPMVGRPHTHSRSPPRGTATAMPKAKAAKSPDLRSPSSAATAPPRRSPRVSASSGSSSSRAKAVSPSASGGRDDGNGNVNGGDSDDDDAMDVDHPSRGASSSSRRPTGSAHKAKVKAELDDNNDDEDNDDDDVANAEDIAARILDVFNRTTKYSKRPKNPHRPQCSECGSATITTSKRGRGRGRGKGNATTDRTVGCVLCSYSCHMKCLTVATTTGKRGPSTVPFDPSLPFVCRHCASDLHKRNPAVPETESPRTTLLCMSCVYPGPSPPAMAAVAEAAADSTDDDNATNNNGNSAVSSLAVKGEPVAAAMDVDPPATAFTSTSSAAGSRPSSAASSAPGQIPAIPLHGIEFSEIAKSISASMFRCRTCFRAEHWTCAAIAGAAAYQRAHPDEPDGMRPDEVLVELLDEGECAHCAMVDSPDVEVILSWRVAQPFPSFGGLDPPLVRPTARDFLVKFSGISYRKTQWVPDTWLFARSPGKYRAYLRAVPTTAPDVIPPPPPDRVIRPSWSRVHKILDVEKSAAEGEMRYLIQWRDLPISQSTWEAKNDLDFKGDADLVRAAKFFKEAASIDSARSRAQRPGNRDVRPDPGSWEGLVAQPKELRNGVMMPHQLEGLSWLIGSWCARSACILADEMGLGKTLQCVSFLQYIHIHEWRFPFLVVVPNSTLENWEREFNKWAPQLHVVSNWGPQVDRDLIAKYELFQLGSDGRPKRSSSLGYSLKCHVVLASYESVMKTSEFKDVRWDCLIVDEGHRLKNDESKLFLHLKELSFDHKILLTGTPLQNNLRELFNLMNFLDPEQFQDPESLAIEYNLRDNSGSTAPTPASVSPPPPPVPLADAEDGSSAAGEGPVPVASTMTANADLADEEPTTTAQEKVKELHALLRPHFLRRIKADIDLDVPPKAEILVPVRMTPLQRQLIKELYSSNFQLIRALGSQAKARSDAAEGAAGGGAASGTGGSGQQGKTSIGSLHNLLVQSRKILSHPFVMSTIEEGLPPVPTAYETHLRMVESGSKLALLAKMLPKLQQDGHKVLIFAQFQRTLDILEDFLFGMQSLAPAVPPGADPSTEPPKPPMRPFSFFRLDGSTERVLRQQYIDEFNTSPDAFAFVLSTRAGGVGINLTAADTVIIFDVDWNPHMDLQAIARAHRIGQKRPVLAYKFMTAQSAEEKMVAVGRTKLALDHVVVQSMGKDGDEDAGVNDSDIMEVVRYGASAVLNDGEGAAAAWQYSDQEVAQLLDRAQAVDLAVVQGGGTGSPPPPGSAAAPGGASSGGFGFSKVWLSKAAAKPTSGDGLAHASSSHDAAGSDGATTDGQPMVADIDAVGIGEDAMGDDQWELMIEKLVAEQKQRESETLGRRKRKYVDYADSHGRSSNSGAAAAAATAAAANAAAVGAGKGGARGETGATDSEWAPPSDDDAPRTAVTSAADNGHHQEPQAKRRRVDPTANAQRPAPTSPAAATTAISPMMAMLTGSPIMQHLPPPVSLPAGAMDLDDPVVSSQASALTQLRSTVSWSGSTTASPASALQMPGPGGAAPPPMGRVAFPAQRVAYPPSASTPFVPQHHTQQHQPAYRSPPPPPPPPPPPTPPPHLPVVFRPNGTGYGSMTSGSRTAAMHAQQATCFLCRGTEFARPTYHVPTSCPAIRDRTWVERQLWALRARPPPTDRSDVLKVQFLQAMIKTFDAAERSARAQMQQQVSSQAHS